MNESPLISVVIPCYDGAQFLPAAIESCLRQTMRDFELIIVDDASPDDSAEIAERYARQDTRIRVIRRAANGGVSEAFNSGFNEARGRYFTRLAQDDVFAENALVVFTDYLDTHPSVGLMYCDSVRIDESGGMISRSTVPEDPEGALLLGNRLGLCVAWRREVWERVGGFNREFDAAEDYDYWLRVWKHFSIAKCVGVAPLLVRKHAGMGTIRFADRQERATVRLLREAYPTKIPPLRRFLGRRKALSLVFLSAAFDYRDKGQPWRAAHRILLSFAAWPGPARWGAAGTITQRLKVIATLIRRKRSSTH
jgi:glycosyltransferase involved in cell wall biosynthesis